MSQSFVLQPNLSLSKSPVRPYQGTAWAGIGADLSKSAVVTNHNVSQSSVGMPSKLQKLKERVARDRSANAVENYNRDGSLYGRKKPLNDLDKECQRLRDSYNQHRKPANRSISGVRSSTASNNMFHKQNFKEEPFDHGDDRSKSFERGPAKENAGNSQSLALQLQQQAESHQNQMNRFKRSQQKSQISLSAYQQKFEKLNQNFKKFTHNLVNPNASEQLITDMRIKTALNIIMKLDKLGEALDSQQAFNLWLANTGVDSLVAQNRDRTMKLMRAANKVFLRTLTHKKIQCYQVWKRMMLGGNASAKDRVVSILSELITSSEEFNRCVENDFYLNDLLAEKVGKILGQVQCEMLFYEKESAEDQESTVLKGYHSQTGEQINLPIGQLLGKSVLGQIISSNLTGEKPLSVYQNFRQERSYNSKIDMPMSYEAQGASSTDCTTLIAIQITQPIEIGIMRIYLRNQAALPSQKLMQNATHLAHFLPQFLSRIYAVRSQINSLAFNNMDQGGRIRDLDFFHKVNKDIYEFQAQISQSPEIASSLSSLSNFTRMKVDQFVQEMLEDDQVQLKQIVWAPEENLAENLMDVDEEELYKETDYLVEDLELIEDFLDDKRDYYVHQLSISPKGREGYSDFAFVLQITNHYQVENANSFVNLGASITSIPVMGMTPTRNADRKGIDEELKRKLVLYFQMFEPVFKQAFNTAHRVLPTIASLTEQIERSKQNYNLQDLTRHLVNEMNLLEEPNFESFVVNLSLVLRTIMTHFNLLDEDDLEQQNYFILINKALFQANSQATDNHLSGVFTTSNLEMLESYLVNFEDSSQQILSSYGLRNQTQDRVLILNESLFQREVSYQNVGDGDLMILLPICDEIKKQAVLAFRIQGQANMQKYHHLGQELAGYLVDFARKRSVFQKIQTKHDTLLQKIQGQQLSQEKKEMIMQDLILPYSQKQSLKTLGEGLDSVCERLLVYSDESGDHGQDISQIAFLSSETYIEDIRLWSTYSQYDPETGDQRVPDDALMACFLQKQKIVYEDKQMNQIALLLPLMSNSGLQTALNQHSCIVLRFMIANDEHAGSKLELIETHFISIVQPLVKAILSGDLPSPKQTLAISKLTSVINRRRFSVYTDTIYHMKDLISKDVYNFQRSHLFDKVVKSCKVQSAMEKTEDHVERKLRQTMLAREMIQDSLTVINRLAVSYKRACFNKFLIGTRTPIYANMSKKKKTSIFTLVGFYQKVTLRELFIRFAVNTRQYRHITHPKTKYLGSVLCFFRNFKRTRQRLAFLKMKKNLNLQLKNAMESYKENDREIFVQLNQILVSSFNQQGGLDGGFSYAINEIFDYLKSTILKDNWVLGVGMVANDGLTGHIDEVILTLKQDVYLPSMCKGIEQALDKLKVMLCMFDHGSTPNEVFLSRDSNLLSQHDGMMSANDFFAEGVEQPMNTLMDQQMGQKTQKYLITLKKDIIHQLLTKSNGITFNFQNIQQSLSEIYASQKQPKEQSIGNRSQIIKRSKSALIIPLFDISGQKVIGSFELYKHHQLAFSEEIERRYESFSKHLSDFFQMYGQLQSQASHIEHLQWQMSRTIRPVQNMSQLLKNVYVNGPGSHFPGACHVLPIILLNQTLSFQPEFQNNRVSSFSDSQRSLMQLKMAFFYQFKDNHIYSFDFQSTFIEEMIANGCILEMSKEGVNQQDENVEQNHNRAMNALIQNQMGIENNNPNLDYQSSRNTLDPNESHRDTNLNTMRSQVEKVRSVTNESFKHIIYYPIFDIAQPTRMVAIFEVGYKKKNSVQEIMNEDIQQYLDEFRSALNQFKIRMNTFASNLENIFIRKNYKRLCQHFQNWKQLVIFMQYKESFNKNHYKTLQNQEACYGEYMKNLEGFSHQLGSSNEEKKSLQMQLTQYNIEKKAKLKFLAASLFSNVDLFKKFVEHRKKQAFQKWQYSISIRKIAESAFNRVLEINHRHTRARYKSGVFLLQNLIEDMALGKAFALVFQAAQKRKYIQNSVPQTRSPHIQRSRSRSVNKHHDNSSFILNNITSLLSPHGRRIDKSNLYAQYINSSMQQPGQSANNSYALNADLMDYRSTVQTAYAAPLEVSRDKSRQKSKKRSTSNRRLHKSKSCGRQSNKQTEAPNQSLSMFNPQYQETNASQVDIYQNLHPGFSPIVVQPQYDIQPMQGGGAELKKRQQSYNLNTSKSHSNLKQPPSFDQIHQSQQHSGREENREPLMKQLMLKQQQLDMIKQQIMKQKQYSVQHSYRTNQLVEKESDARTSDLSHTIGSHQYHNSVPSNVPLPDKKRQRKSKEKRRNNHVMDQTDNSYVSANVYDKIALFSQSDSERSLMQPHPKYPHIIPDKYAHTSGREISPPVRDSGWGKVPQANLPEHAQQQKAAQQIADFLHQKYQNM